MVKDFAAGGKECEEGKGEAREVILNV